MPRHPDTSNAFVSPSYSWHLNRDLTAGEAPFDRLSRLVLRLLQVPFAVLTLLEDEHLQVHSIAGTLASDIDVAVTQLACDYAYRTARSGDVLAIQEMLVPVSPTPAPLTVPYSIAYLGIPLVASDGHVVGVISVVAPGPRQWSADDLTAIQDFAMSMVPAIVAWQANARFRSALDTPSLPLSEWQAPKQTLKHSEDHFRLLIERALDIIVVLKADGTIQYSSSSIERILGYRAADVLGACSITFIHPNDRVNARQQCARALKHLGMTIAIEVRVKHTDADWRILEAVGQGTIDPHGNRTITLYARDVTARMQVQEGQQRERSRLARRISERTMELSAANIELARSARLKDDFLASISHELRTPLNVILGVAEALQESVYGAVSPRQLQALRDIEASGQHLLVLINDLLDLSKLEAGKLEMHFTPIVVADVCQSSIQMIAQEAEHKQIQVTFTIDAAVTSMRADKLRLRQMLFHLLSNAVKFTPAAGTIGLDVWSDVEHDLVRFSVWDSGIGIAHEHLLQLFQPFVQLDSSLARQYTGTGLGLVLVNRLLELHGGGITVESEIDHGSRFTLWLPWRHM